MLTERQQQTGSDCFQVLDTTASSAPTPSQTPALFLQPLRNSSRGLSNETAQGELNFPSLELSWGLAPKPRSSKAQQTAKGWVSTAPTRPATAPRFNPLCWRVLTKPAPSESNTPGTRDAGTARRAGSEHSEVSAADLTGGLKPVASSLWRAASLPVKPGFKHPPPWGQRRLTLSCKAHGDPQSSGFLGMVYYLPSEQEGRVCYSAMDLGLSFLLLG